MVTINGYTAAKMDEISDATVVAGTVNGDGDLILITRDSTEINAGSVIGPIGGDGPTGPTSIVVCTSSTRPTGGARFEGLMIYETNTDRMYVWDGLFWIPKAISTICTSSTRPALPFEGMEIYETDTHEKLIYNGVAFRKPWNMPWGIVDDLTMTGNELIANTAGEFDSGLHIDVTATGHRKWKVSLAGPAIHSSVADDEILIYVKENGGTVMQTYALLPAAFSHEPFSVFTTRTPAAGSVEYRIFVSRTNGSGTGGFISSTNGPSTLLVEDIGPDGSPL